MTLRTYTYQQAIADTTLSVPSPYGYITGFAGTSGENLLGHWPMQETSGTTMTDTSGNGNNGTYRGVSTGHTIVGNLNAMATGPNPYSVYFDGDKNNGGASVPSSPTFNSSGSLIAINAWVQVQTIPTSDVALGITATGTSGSTVMSVSLSNQQVTNINNFASNNYPVTASVVGVPSGSTLPWLTKGSGQWITAGTMVVSATNSSITLSKPVKITGALLINLSPTARPYSYGNIISKSGDYGLAVSHFTGNNSWPAPYDASSNINPVLTISNGNLSRSSSQDTFFTNNTAMVSYIASDAFFEYLYVNGVLVVQNYSPLFTAPSSNSGLTIFQAATNQVTAAMGSFTGLMQNLTVSNAFTDTWYIQLLYTIGTNGTLVYDDATPNIRYPGTLNGSTYSAPTSVTVSSWPTTIVGPNPNRKRITITNDSAASIWLSLTGTDFTNPTSSPLWMNRPVYALSGTGSRVYPVGIELVPMGGMWSSDYYTGAISAVANPLTARHNLCVMEEVA